MSLPPPVPFSDFEFTFDPALSNLFPPQQPLPSSADLFSPSETTDLLGFLDNFNWEFDSPHNPSYSPYPTHRPTSSTSSTHSPTDDTSVIVESNANTTTTTTANNSSSASTSSATPPARSSPPRQPPEKPTAPPTRSKPLLSTPQKRLNHIMSEQKRRNAIRDGYAQLIGLLAPAGTAPGIGMPTRGRPKGSGSRGKGRSKGKSGVLFRAVEYCRWLEDSRDALRDEVVRVEAAAGIAHD